MFNDSFWDGKKLSIIIILVIFLLSLVYFANFLSYNKMIYGSDWILSGYSNHYSWINYIKFHRRLPMWDGYNFSGNPIMATRGGGGMVYPLNIFYFIFPVHFGWTVMYIIHTFLAGLGMWLLLKEYKLSSLSSLVGAISFMFAGQLITTTEGGHLGRMIAAVFLPFAFLFLHRAMRSKNIRDFIIFGGITGLFLLAGHVQISYWAMLGIVIYFIYEVIRRRDELKIQGLMKITWFFSIGIVIILLIASIKLLPPALSLGYGARGVTRGYEYTTSWSLPTSELFNLVVPHFSGILNNYWGENFFKLDSRYLGILPLILFGFAFFYRKDRHLIKFFAFLTGITLILALGKNTPLFKIYYYLIPMAKKFRGPSMFFFLTTFGVAIISGFGAEVLINLCREKSSEINKKMIGYLLGFVAIVIIATLIVNIGDEGILKATSNHFVKVWTGILPRANIQQKISLMIRNFDNFKRSLWMTTLLTILNGGLIFIMLKRKLNYKIIIPFLLVILLIDVWSIDKSYIRASEPPERLFAPDDVTRFISTDKGVFRAYPFNYENRDRDGYLQYNDIENVGGYGPNPPKRYQEFIGAGSSVMFSAPNFITYPHLLSMLNVKYIIGPHLPVDLSKYDERVKKIIEQYKEFYSNFEVLGGGVRYQVLENKNTLPRVSLLYEYTVVDNEKEILDRILLQEFELGKMAFLEGKSEFTISEGKGSVEIEKYIANDRVFKIVTDKPAFLIVRENHHPHWKCYINGEERKIYRANYVFYGVFVPEGEHIVRFVYESPLFNIVTALSFAGFLIFLVAVVFSLKRPISRLQNI